jgi:hypothetical protein
LLYLSQNNNNNNNNNNQLLHYSTATTTSVSVSREIEPDVPLERLSRHVPNRDEMDLGMSSMILSTNTNNNSHSHNNGNHHLQNNIHFCIMQ